MKRASTAKSSKSGRLKTTGGSGRRSRNNKTGTVTPSRDALLETEDEVAEQHRRALEDVKQQLTREKFKVTQLLNKQRTDEHRHKDEIRQIKARGHELGDRLAIAEARWKKFSSVELALANLCIELRERSGDDPVQEADYEQERTDLLRAANHDPLIILDNLRANLRIQLAFKEDYEHELKATLQQKWDTQQMEINRLRARIKEMDRELVVVKDRRDHAEREVEAAEARGRAASEKAILSMQKDKMEVESWKKRVATHEVELSVMRTQMYEMEQRSMAQNAEVLRVAELQSKLHTARSNHERALQKAQRMHLKEMERYEKRMMVMKQVEAHRDALQEENKRLEKRVKSYKTNVSARKLEGAETKALKNEQAAIQLRKKLADAEERGKLFRLRAEQRAKALENMKSVHDRLRKRMSRIEKEKDAMSALANGLTEGGAEGAADRTDSAPFDASRVNSMSRQEVKERVNRNPYYVQHYKDKCRKLEREKKELVATVRRLMAREGKLRIERSNQRKKEDHYRQKVARLEDSLRTGERKMEQMSRELSAASPVSTAFGEARIGKGAPLARGEREQIEDEEDDNESARTLAWLRNYRPGGPRSDMREKAEREGVETRLGRNQVGGKGMRKKDGWNQERVGGAVGEGPEKGAENEAEIGLEKGAEMGREMGEERRRKTKKRLGASASSAAILGSRHSEWSFNRKKAVPRHSQGVEGGSLMQSCSEEKRLLFTPSRRPKQGQTTRPKSAMPRVLGSRSAIRVGTLL